MMNQDPGASLATRQSIKQYFPLGQVLGSGFDNPVTLHAVDEDLFRCVWSAIAETMVVEGELLRSTKEDIASTLSQLNDCPVCFTAHNMMGTAAMRAEKDNHQQQPDYDKIMQYASEIGRGIENPSFAPELSPAVKAEIGLVILIFQHMNRAVSAIMGEEMSTAMFSIPRPIARSMESISTMKVVNNMLLAPLLSGGMGQVHKPGITRALVQDFELPQQYTELPAHLKGVIHAGVERKAAILRLHYLTDHLYDTKVQQIVQKQTIDLLLDIQSAKPSTSVPPNEQFSWCLEKISSEAGKLANPTDETVAQVLLLVSNCPKAVFGSDVWKTLQDNIGKETSRLIVLWWSLRVALKEAQGFDAL